MTFLNKRRALTAAAGFFLFVIISYFVVTRDTLAFDTAVRNYIYGFRSGGLTVFFKAVTYLGNWQTVTLICLLSLLAPRLRLSFGVPMSAAAILAAMLQKLLKVSFHRARPDLTLHLITQGGYSFPSGHSFTVLIFYGILIFLCRRYVKNKTAANLATALLSCLILAIGFSRIYLGVHYPTDVLGGWALGVCVLMLMISAVLFLQKRQI
ncbi:MAG TPA: phosphatase PAP2 family protein [Bacillota bacterium]|nr:phosphatase PAP2 family protein [Bacillota bacterium]